MGNVKMSWKVCENFVNSAIINGIEIMKILKLKNKEADKLIQLMNRGLAYTDAHYMDYKSQEKIFNLVKNQLVIK